jgi:predicted ATP-grasp superfamily ATP-dependent carboligase
LIQTYEMVSAWEKEVVVQEWIAGGDDRVGFCLTYSRLDAQPLALFPGRKLIQWPVGWGNTALCEPALQQWAAALVALTRKIWENVGYVGLGSMDKFRPGSDTPIIMEPTVGRTDFQSELAVMNGVNLPAIAYSDLAALPPPPSIVPSMAMKLIDGPSHLRAARVFVASPDLRMATWIKARRGYKRYMIVRAGDCGPFLGSIYSSLRSSVGNILQWLLGDRLKQRLRARAAK